MPNDSQNGLCPLIGLANDRTVMFSEVSALHRCYAKKIPRKPTEVEQETYCLASAYPACQYFDEAAVGWNSPREEDPRSVQTNSTEIFRFGPMALIGLLFTVIVSGVVFTGVVVTVNDVPEPVSVLKAAIGFTDPASDTADLNDEAVIDSSSRISETSGSALDMSPDMSIASLGFDLAAPSGADDENAELAEGIAGLILVPTPTPTPDAAQTNDDDNVLTLRPGGDDVGWWNNNDSRRNYVGDSFLYAGTRGDDTFVSAIKFDLSQVARGAKIESATLSLTGLRQDQIITDGSGNWMLQLVPESSLDELAEADFLTLYSAPASIVLFPQLSAYDLEEGRTNIWELDHNALAWLEQQIFNGDESVYVRIQSSPDGGADGLFAWDSGVGSESNGNPPTLTLKVGSAPPTPPPLPTRPQIIATLTPVPENVVTVVAQSVEATANAIAFGTNTPLPYAVVTPTSLPQNLATVAAAALAQGKPAVVLSTPTPASFAAATADARYATAVAQTTGTFTPVPTGFVTPVLIMPSPPAQSVATEAARIAEATWIAQSGAATPTPLPFNGVIGEYIYATPVPGNKATAAAELVIASAQASVNGTPTPLPWYVVVITEVPPPTATPIPLFLEPTATPLPFTPTPLPDGLPPEVYGRVIFLSDRTGSDEPHLLDMATGEIRLITQQWVYDFAREQLVASPDGQQMAVVEGDISRPNRLYWRPFSAD